MGLIAFIALFSVLSAVSYHLWRSQKSVSKPIKARSNDTDTGEPPVITPLPNFQWDEEEPIKYRPFKKGPYNMTMNIRNLPAEEQFVLDRTYLNKVNARTRIVEAKGDDFIFCLDHSQEPVKEFYDHFISFMTTRYPTCFVLQDDGYVLNTMKNETLPGSSDFFGTDMRQLLFTLAKHTEDDLLILIPGEQEYTLIASIFLLPSGFDPKKLAGKGLSAIHQGVPQYESKLKLAMNKFFSRVKPYQFVYRVNWSIQTHQHINDVGLNHGKPGVVPVKLKAENLDFNKIFLRCERQTLTRLPKSKAVIMTTKTYFTPMIKLREEEDSRERLCQSIEGLSGDFAIYKNKPKWDQAIFDYLQKRSDGITSNIKEFIFQD